MHTFNPFHKFRVAAISFGVVAVLAAWNGVFNCVSDGVVLPVNSIVLSDTVENIRSVKPGFVPALGGLGTAVGTVTGNYFTKFTEIEFKYESTYLGVFCVVPEHVAQICLPSRFLSSWAFGHHFRFEATAALHSALGQMAGSGRSLFSARAPALPHNVSPGLVFNGVAIADHCEPPKQFSRQFNSILCMT